MRSPAFVVKPAAVAFMALMAATRFHHFGSPFALPDASLAIFFLAGLWLGGRYVFTLLLAEAGLIDYLAITQLGVSDYCISQAYVFLLPTYAAMWLGGKWCRQFTQLTASAAIKQLAALVVASSSAFLISNGSFFLFSGRYPDGSWSQYVAGFAAYYPPYMASTLVYGIIIFALVELGKQLFARKIAQQAV
jgi:hypothetical protein